MKTVQKKVWIVPIRSADYHFQKDALFWEPPTDKDLKKLREEYETCPCCKDALKVFPPAVGTYNMKVMEE